MMTVQKFILRTLFLIAPLIAACSTTVPLRSADLQSPAGQSSAENAPAFTVPIRVHVAVYRDARRNAPSREIGEIKTSILGLNTNHVVIEEDVSDIATAALKGQFAREGYQLADGANAQFEVSGIVREFSLNITARDELTIVVQTAVRDVKSGAVVWSGVVTEKTNRYAGTLGDTRQDVFKYLGTGIHTVAQKTVDAVTGSLKQAHAELFIVVPQAAPAAPGVTVLTPPPAPPPVAQLQPQPVPTPSAAPVEAPKPEAIAATTGYLSVTTKPSRVKVYVDEVYYGLSPLKLELATGISTVRLKADGYKTDTEKVSIRKNETTELEVTLLK